MNTLKINTLAAALGLVLTTPVAQGATITSDFELTASSSLFGGAPLENFSIGPDSFGVKSLAEVHYEAKASAGTVDASVKARLEATHPDVLSFGAAAATPVDLSLVPFVIQVPDIFPVSIPDIVVPGSFGSFETQFGIEADVELELFGAVDLPLLNIDGLLETSASTFEPFNDKISADDEASIASAGNITKVNLLFATLRFGAKATVFATQESELSFGNLIGTVRATHENGAVVTQSFALDQVASLSLNLQQVGDWTLGLTDITVLGDFSTEFGMRIGGKACVVVCASVSSGILPIGSASFDLPFSDHAVSLGTLTVLTDYELVPLPAGLPLLAGALGMLAVLRRRRASGQPGAVAAPTA